MLIIIIITIIIITITITTIIIIIIIIIIIHHLFPLEYVFMRSIYFFDAVRNQTSNKKYLPKLI